MDYRSKQLKGRAVCGSDAGDDSQVGEVVDVYFDDQQWVVRYVVVETGHWFDSRQVLVSPSSIDADQPDERRLRVRLTRQQIRDSPDVDTQRPVSRQYEARHAAYYGYPLYWMGGGLWGPGALPFGPGVADTGDDADPARHSADTHLRSCREVVGYHIEAVDGSIGHVDDFVVDRRSWQIRRLAIDTRNWLPGKHVQIDPQAITGIDWSARKVRVKLTREQIRSAPSDDAA